MGKGKEEKIKSGCVKWGGAEKRQQEHPRQSMCGKLQETKDIQHEEKKTDLDHKLRDNVSFIHSYIPNFYHNV